MAHSSGDDATPLGIRPLRQYQLDDDVTQPAGPYGLEGGHYQVLQKLVSASPIAKWDEDICDGTSDDDNGAEIETCLEQFVDSSNGSVLWRRVVVRSGPSCPQQVTHASYMLPEDCATSSIPVTSDGTGLSVLCWTAFPDRPHHQMLCVLANPTLLCIWDVYPGGTREDLGGEGHSIPLPFEACGIHAVDASFGLLLQRAETVEDRHAFEYQNGNGNGDDDDGFVLKAPPRPVRLRDSTGGSTLASLNLSASQATAGLGGAPSSTIPSLFSLSHPLDDILPVSTFSEGDLLAGVATDVFEKVLFVGVVKWVDEDLPFLDMVEHSQPICVTYHSQLKRHAVWEIKHTPPPPPQAPLWQVSSQLRSRNGLDSHLGVLQQDLEDLELVGTSDMDSSHYDLASRKDALAHALGVRRTPRNAASVDTLGPRARGLVGVGLPTRSKTKNSINTTLLSPLSRANNESHNMELDTSGPREQHSMLQMMGPFATLHPKTTFSCIFCETEPSPVAEAIFLASNATGSGNLSLCLVCPNTSQQHEGLSNPKCMRLFSLAPRSQTIADHDKSTLHETLARQFTVCRIGAIPCIAAQPIEACHAPKNYEPHRRNNSSGLWKQRATDILVLSTDVAIQGYHLSLYRSTQYIVECYPIGYEARSNERLEVTGLRYSTGNAVSILFVDKSRKVFAVRGCLSIDPSSLGEKVLQCLEVAFVNCGLYDLALKMRADCKRLEQAVFPSSEKCCSDSSSDIKIGAEGAKTVVLALFLWELLAVDVNFIGKAESTNETRQSSWDKLRESTYYTWYSKECQDFSTPSPATRTTADGFHSVQYFAELSSLHSLSVKRIQSSKTNLASTMFDSLHLLYEDLKLHNCICREGLEYVGSILSEACWMASQNPLDPNKIPELYLNHYARDLETHQPSEFCLQSSNVLTTLSEMTRQTQFSVFSSPPCILSWMEGILSAEPAASIYNDIQYSHVNAACSRTRSILRIFSLLSSHETDPLGLDQAKIRRRRDLALVDLLIEEGFSDQTTLCEELPLGICLPFLEVLHRCRMVEMDEHSLMNAGAWALIGRDDLYRNLVASNEDFNVSICNLARGNDGDGVTQLEATSSMLFPDDNRLREVGRLLRSSRPIYLHVPRAIEVSDHDYERNKQEKLLLSSRRTLALSVGRGMITIGNLKPVPAEPLPVPDLCLSGRVPPTNATLALDTSDCPADFKVWPEFHNGVAAGLRLPLHQDAAETVSKITRTWIVYNRPTNSTSGESQSNSNSPESSTQGLNHSHGGLLMALGLRGHLTALEMTDIFDYLTHGTVTTTVGVLLGMAANMRGTCDISVSKMLCLHIPSLIPQHFSTIDVASTVQAAAVAGAGLLYEGSCHRMMTEFLLNEIGKRPSSDGNILDREAYTLACGIALGMVNLCQGGNDSSDSGAGLEDLRIEERLYRYVVGGLDDEEMRRRREESDRLGVPSTSTMGNNERCSCIYEGESINTDVTAPGATLALGLIYMRSGNKTIASSISLPDTHFLLEYVRPDFLMLRVIARALILWDEVEPSRQWVETQLPKAARLAYEEMRKLAESFPREGIDSKGGTTHAEYDRHAVRLIYTHVIAAACFSIGLRFAGTGNKDAASVIFERVVELRELRDATSPASSALRPPTPVLEMCLGCACISLSMVLAGTGDLDALRLLKVLRWPCTEEINYGSHLAFGSAIGLLFLGGGTCTLGREPKDIAALLLAFFPRFPSSTSDNQYHLQALRNLYALAVKHREIRAIDVNTGESVFVPIEVHFETKDSEPKSLTAPCLLLNTDENPYELRVVSKHHFPQTVKFDIRDGKKVFFVQRRSAYLCHMRDPDSHGSVLKYSDDFQRRDPQLEIRALTDDPSILSFAKHFCGVVQTTIRKDVSGPFSLSKFCTQVLQECFMKDKQEALPLYLTLRSAISLLEGESCSPSSIAWDFRLIRSFYHIHPRAGTSTIASSSFSSTRLLNCELVAYLIELLESTLANGDLRQGFMSIYYNASYPFFGGQNWGDDTDEMDLS